MNGKHRSWKDKMNQDVAPTSEQTFHRFTSFSNEIQMMIWKWYGRISAETPNVIKIYRRIETFLAEGPLPKGHHSRKQLMVHLAIQTAGYTLPPIFYVCGVSRMIAKKLYQDEFQVIPMGSKDDELTYFNEDKDVIVLENIFVFKSWRYNRQTESEARQLVPTRTHQAAQEPIRRRINIKHLVIDGLIQSSWLIYMLGRFYDCETIMLATNLPIGDERFDSCIHHLRSRTFLQEKRDRLRHHWGVERQGPYVRQDYRGKQVRPAVVEPSWDPAEQAISNPVLLFWSADKIFTRVTTNHPAVRQKPSYPMENRPIGLQNGMVFSHQYAKQYDFPWRTYIG